MLAAIRERFPLKYSKPTLVPSEYNVAKEFEDCFIKYENSSKLTSLIVEFSTNQSKMAKQKKITYDSINKYTLSYLQSIFKK